MISNAISNVRHTPSPDYAQKQKGEKDERDCRLAADVLRMAVDAAARHPEAKSADEICKDAETMWKWVVSD